MMITATNCAGQPGWVHIEECNMQKIQMHPSPYTRKAQLQMYCQFQYKTTRNDSDRRELGDRLELIGTGKDLMIQKLKMQAKMKPNSNK